MTMARITLRARPMVDASGTGREVCIGSRLCENSNARRVHRDILEKLRVMRTDNAADIRLDAMLENCIFYNSSM
jgi:hypothetical protein